METGSPLGALLTVSTLKTTVFLLHKRFWQICSGVEAIAGCSAGDRGRVGRRGPQPGCPALPGTQGGAAGLWLLPLPKVGRQECGWGGAFTKCSAMLFLPPPFAAVGSLRRVPPSRSACRAWPPVLAAGGQVGPSRPLLGPGRWAHGTGASFGLRASVLMPVGGLGKTGWAPPRLSTHPTLPALQGLGPRGPDLLRSQLHVVSGFRGLLAAPALALSWGRLGFRVLFRVALRVGRRRGFLRMLRWPCWWGRDTDVDAGPPCTCLPAPSQIIRLLLSNLHSPIGLRNSHCLSLFFFWQQPGGMKDLSSPTREPLTPPSSPEVEERVLTTGPPGKSLSLICHYLSASHFPPSLSLTVPQFLKS